MPITRLGYHGLSHVAQSGGLLFLNRLLCEWRIPEYESYVYPDFPDVGLSTLKGTFPFPHPYFPAEAAMRAYFCNLSIKTWILLVLPALAIAYPVARIVVPTVIRAVVPEVVRNVLNVI